MPWERSQSSTQAVRKPTVAKRSVQQWHRISVSSPQDGRLISSMKGQEAEHERSGEGVGEEGEEGRGGGQRQKRRLRETETVCVREGV